MFTDLSVLAIACLNLAVIVPTKLLHTNLKSILITQSFAILFFAFENFCQLSVAGTHLSTGRAKPTDLNFFDRHKRLSDFAGLQQSACEQSSNTTKFNLITSALSMVFSFVEYLLIALIGRYNQKMYNRQMETTSSNNYNIGFRYQISDNINSAKQLYATSNSSIAILCVAIELTIMTHHPLLKKRLFNLFLNLYCFKRPLVNNVRTITVETAAKCVEKKGKRNERALRNASTIME
ncbi:hypothetical protein niasHS_011430 [Heterodera schachtii]|uniref:Uncharacterized protein n=1 Tax=Heterodera schachtii TaxID=97005 RepID=A0ABD2IDX6_HETSC